MTPATGLTSAVAHPRPRRSQGSNLGVHPKLVTRVEDDPSPGHHVLEAHRVDAGAELLSDEDKHTLALLMKAEMLDDIESVRIANNNRLCAMEKRGWDTTLYAAHMDALEKIEHDLDLALKREIRIDPLYPWVRGAKGVGEKQAARLLAALGDPAWNAKEERPRRGPAELWAYCGFAPGQRRKKGVKSNWNPTAKSRAFLIAHSAVKAGVRKLPNCNDTLGYDVTHRESITEYGEVYLSARKSWADRDTTDGHKHNHALRVTAKAILRDLFLEAKRVSDGGVTTVRNRQREAND